MMTNVMMQQSIFIGIVAVMLETLFGYHMYTPQNTPFITRITLFTVLFRNRFLDRPFFDCKNIIIPKRNIFLMNISISIKYTLNWLRQKLSTIILVKPIHWVFFYKNRFSFFSMHIFTIFRVLIYGLWSYHDHYWTQ